MEQLLHYVWQYRMLPVEPLKTTDGDSVEVIDPGLHNTDAGPDFFNAKVRLSGTMWVGNVEIHQRSSDWVRHGHHTDPAYDSVVLHIAETVDSDVYTQSGRRLPQLQLSVPASVREHYDSLLSTQDYPRCWRIIPSLPSLKTHSWLSALLYERLTQRGNLCLQRLQAVGGDWERTTFITLARNFGFGINGDAFETWARHMPLHAAAKHHDNLFQLEALFLGSAGLLSSPEADDYLQRLRAEWDYLAHKFQLPAPMSPSLWRYLRLRPQNFPHLRIAQLAQLYHRQTATYSRLLEATSRQALHEALDTEPSEYWRNHYLFGMPSAPSRKRLSAASRDLIIINTVAPLLFATGMAHDKEALQERAMRIIDELKPEQNYITRQWQQCGITAQSAADSQALIQLKREYCDRRDCLRCRFGYEYLKSK